MVWWWFFADNFMRYLVVNSETGEVLNAVEWDGKSTWTPPKGYVLHIDKEGVADLGDKLNDPKSLEKGVTKAEPKPSPKVESDPVADQAEVAPDADPPK